MEDRKGTAKNKAGPTSPSPVAAPNPDPPSKPPGNKDIWAVLLQLARSVPPPLAGFVLVAVFALAWFRESENSGFAHSIVIVTAVVTIVYLFLYSKAFQEEERRRMQAEDTIQAKSRRLEASESRSAPSQDIWSRLEVKLDMPEERLLDIRMRLKDIHATSFTLLSKSIDGLTEDQVRVNVMVPDNRRARYGEVCHLFIPRWLHVNMDQSPDKDIRFSLTQGLVGIVFTSSKPGGAVQEEGGWSRVFFGEEEPQEPGVPDFELTDWQRNKLHPELRWVLSLPLLYSDAEGTTHALGVLNIDGLVHTMAPELLGKFFLSITEKATVIAALLNELPKQRLSILLQEVADENALHENQL